MLSLVTSAARSTACPSVSRTSCVRHFLLLVATGMLTDLFPAVTKDMPTQYRSPIYSSKVPIGMDAVRGPSRAEWKGSRLTLTRPTGSGHDFARSRCTHARKDDDDRVCDLPHRVG